MPALRHYPVLLLLTLLAGDGSRTIYARFRDGAGNVSDVKTVTVVIDQTAPQAPVPSSFSKWYRASIYYENLLG